MILRPAEPGDVDAVHRLDRQLFGPDAWSARSVHEELLGARRVALVVTERDVVVGYLVTAAAGDVVDLQRVAVRPDHRRRGVARRLLAAATDRAEAHRMLLEVSADNVPALRFYAAEGFTEIDRRPRYYRDGSDAVVLARPAGRGADRHRHGVTRSPGPGTTMGA